MKEKQKELQIHRGRQIARWMEGRDGWDVGCVLFVAGLRVDREIEG